MPRTLDRICTNLPRATLAAVACLFLAVPALLVAQEPAAEAPVVDEFADPAAEAPAAAPAAPDAAAPVAAEAPAPDAAGGSPVPPADLAAASPAARAVLNSNPQTPSELVRAISVLIDLNSAALAKPLVEKLVAAQLDDAAAAALIDEFGTAMLVKMSRIAVLNPQAETFATDIQTRAARYVRSPERIGALVAELAQADPYVRRRATGELRSSGDAAVAALVAALADPQQAAAHDAIREAIVTFGEVAIDPLAGTLREAPDAMRLEAIGLLAQIPDHRAAEILLAASWSPEHGEQIARAARAGLERLAGKLPNQDESASRLHEAAARHLARSDELRAPAPAAQDGVFVVDGATLWHWDGTAHRPVAETVPPAIAEFRTAAELSAVARRLAPENAEIRRLALATAAELALLAPAEGGANPAQTALQSEQPADLADMLAWALATKHDAAAQVAADLLGATGDPSILYVAAPQPAPLAYALQSANRDVRFAAAKAVMQLAPDRSYPGASYLPTALAEIVQCGGHPRAVVGHRSAAEATRLAGYLAGEGYEIDAADTPDSLMLAAIADSDLALVLLDMSLAAPTSAELVSRLRRDARTSRTPIFITAGPGDTERAGTLARKFENVWAIVIPVSPAGLQAQLARVLPTGFPTDSAAARRLDEAQQALVWVGQLADRPTHIYDLRRIDESPLAALNLPQLAPTATAALARLDTPRAQRGLVDFASQNARPIALREAAAAAFCDSVVRHGTLLTTDEILRQYDRYNASEQLDRPTQNLLGSILDAIEKRAAADREALSSTAAPAPASGS